jgi:branched-chain amino acid aminotransferase
MTLEQMIINLNGKIVPKEEARISVLDHGFLYGASVYETLRTYGGKPFLLDAHLTRLRESAQGICLNLPFSDSQIKEEVRKTLRASGNPESALRIIVTCGEGDLGYDPALCTSPSLVLLVYPLVPPPPEIYEKGVALSLVSVQRNLAGALNPVVKSGNLLNPRLAWIEANRKGAYEALMQNYKGELTECTMSNLFLVRNQALKTPAPECGILPGLTRNLVLQVARDQYINVQETSLFPDDLLEADEAFLTVTSREIVPVVRCDDRIIGTGRPGPLTVWLHERYRDKVMALMNQCE